MTSLPAHEGDGPQVIHGDCIEVILGMGDNSVDSIVTDPPYGLGFMGKKWDALPPGQDWAEECLRVLKPGGYLLAFGGTRTWHRLAVAIEDAGFEIRDSIAWMYGSGLPKHRAALKPAFEPIVMARKPFKGSLAANEAAHGTGALSIDGCRIGEVGGGARCGSRDALGKCLGHGNAGRSTSGATFHAAETEGGRWPANVILDEDMADVLDGQSGITPSNYRTNKGTRDALYADSGGGAARFFYVAKAPKRERPIVDGLTHSTVKPLALMRWLVRLVTPEGGTVLEPFAGSGATVEACILEGLHCIAIEREVEHIPLIQQRIERAA